MHGAKRNHLPASKRHSKLGRSQQQRPGSSHPMMQSDKPCRMGVDIGGTFTDIVLIEDDGTVYSKKVLSTPHDYSEAIQDGVTSLLDEIGRAPSAIREFAHATTVATNTIIERKGVRCALVTTRGFRDVLELGRY